MKAGNKDEGGIMSWSSTRKIGWHLVTAVMMIVVQPVWAEQMVDLQKQIRSLREDIENLKEAFEADQEVREIGILKKVDFSFYATLEYEDFANRNSSFDARNVELLVSAQLHDRLNGAAEIEFERTAVTSGSRAGQVEVEQGWLEYVINDYMKPRFGVILVPFGRFNLEHFDPFRDLTDRPIVMRRVVPVTWAEAGAGFTGSAFLGEKLGRAFENFALDYQLFLVNGFVDSISDTSSRGARGTFGSDNNNNKALIGRLGLNPWRGVEVGLSGYSGSYDSFGHNIHGFDGDWKLTHGPFELIGEYASFDLETDATTSVPDILRGYFAQVNYHFWFNFLNNTFLGRDFDAPTFTAVFRTGQARINDDNDTGMGLNKEKRQTLGLNYRPVETFVFKFEYQFNQTENESLERGDDDGFIASVSAAF